ncbi:uncharacterized protein CIMG_04478 [Coccidioides immitis RS]|uniref:N-acetylglucosamine-induced protein 1 n=4 Tax=Coccidioides immitis TaxID=5501 RepID=A0A0E1RX38_COCIM|nr:uncharacterized protein CIMG_04478 [Coccidioides immitis RS]KMP04620.1 hypothetical protein CIRG_04301 [Coccidioides immitis RMSCC 2394]KMU79466.1 hypothetical protein CISG_07897 [Coccidioides immitis RMSCC 3703]KMU90426.1 hypothetical protein CIHG_08236 [Coccidioides immitis H538.4]TPX22648.1 hypothetical protein DIZ76_014526 [Coccidioides immitis]EAS33454.1 hypothetical protein CIMG_04478 [Coccidioides immitis RS]
MPNCSSPASIPTTDELPAAATAATQLASKITETEPLPYWLVNVSPEQWPSECPEFLRNLPEKSIKILSTPDSEYVRQDWQLVKQITATNQIHLFHRVPSHLRKYLEYMAKIKATYGSVLDFIIKERLRWDDLKPKSLRPFEHSDDYKVLYNDWPYGVEEDIVHLVVWTKFELEDDPATDDLTPQARREIDDFVGRVFRSKVPSQQVVWFKNWKSLKSVHSVEHFHIMLKAPDMAFVHEITNGDVPLVAKVRAQ